MRSRLRLIQEFSIRLYLDQDFCNLYEKDKLQHLGQFGLSSNEENLFPNVHALSFKAESHGRKFLIAKEIAPRFNNFFRAYFKNETVSINTILNSSLFRNFLQSDEFYTKHFCFPHYAGIGQGHENVSKFYFYAKKLLLNSNERLSLFLDISAVLNFHSSLSDVDFYKPFKHMAWFNFEEDIVVVKSGKWVRIKGNWDQSTPGNIHNIVLGDL
jgi:hypothetical protein